MGRLQDYIEERAKIVGNYILAHNATVRATGKALGLSKSTVHKDILRLKQINPEMYEQISLIMQQHFETKYICGGEATKRRWQQSKQN